MSRTEQPSGRSSFPGAALTVLVWHLAIVLLGAGWFSTLSPLRPPGCLSTAVFSCLSPRESVLLVTTVVGVPALVASLLVSTAAAARLSRNGSRTPQRAGALASVIGWSVTAAGGLVLVGLWAGALSA